MRANSYILGGFQFDSKKAVIEHARRILYEDRVGSKVSRDDEPFLLDLVKLHPYSDTKLAKGCVGFVRSRFASEPAPHFEIMHDELNTTSFSFQECITPKTRIQKVLAAFRYEITEFHQNKKRQLFRQNPYCAISGKKLEWSDTHLDHYPVTFQEIVVNFLKTKGMTIENVRLTKLQRGVPKDVIDDVRMAEEFEAYHQRVARYRLLHKREHMKLTRCKR